MDWLIILTEWRPDLEDLQDTADSTANVTEEPKRSRHGRARDPALDVAILDATMDLLAEMGYARLTMEQVAARAHVGKASVYLRWPN